LPSSSSSHPQTVPSFETPTQGAGQRFFSCVYSLNIPPEFPFTPPPSQICSVSPHSFINVLYFPALFSPRYGPTFSPEFQSLHSLSGFLFWFLDFVHLRFPPRLYVQPQTNPGFPHNIPRNFSPARLLRVIILLFWSFPFLTPIIGRPVCGVPPGFFSAYLTDSFFFFTCLWSTP